MKLDADFSLEELEAIAQMAKRFPRTSRDRIKEDRVELLLADDEYDSAYSAMSKIKRECSDKGVYINAMRER